MKLRLLVFYCLAFLLQNGAAQEFRSSKEDFQKIVNYLSNGSGKWMAPNPNYDPDNPNSAKALGLWFDKRLKGKHLHLSVVTYRGDTAHISSDAMWIWHPGEQRIKYTEVTLGGRLQEGEVYFNADDTFVNRNFQYQLNGKTVFARGENIILTEDRHKTTSYIFENNTWQVQGSLEWRLTNEGEGYKSIKYY
ncbi:MAG: hypothetical protein ABJG78_07035 [Cyclobacteriaceae bacterium]